MNHLKKESGCIAMDFPEQLKSFTARIPKLSESIFTEEATKTALVMPFLSILGYNVFDPTEVIPEFTADHGTKKGEKVDYAVCLNNQPEILIECKALGSDLNNNQASQLFRYYSVTNARVGVLTNGVKYRFFSDLDSPNKMDAKPFYEVDMLNLREKDVNELKRFTKEVFDPNDLTSIAISLKYTNEIIQILQDELNSPSDEFVKFFARHVYNGQITKNVLEKFRYIVKDARNQFINEKINSRLKMAMSETKPEEKVVEADSEDEPENDDGIFTTVEEWEGFYIVRAILRSITDANRVNLRDTKSYCGVLFDNSNRKPICRLRFNSKQKYLGIFDENKKEQKIPINDLSEIYDHADVLKKTVEFYDSA